MHTKHPLVSFYSVRYTLSISIEYESIFIIAEITSPIHTQIAISFPAFRCYFDQFTSLQLVEQVLLSRVIPLIELLHIHLIFT